MDPELECIAILGGIPNNQFYDNTMGPFKVALRAVYSRENGYEIILFYNTKKNNTTFL